jgi:hypothetical protein
LQLATTRALLVVVLVGASPAYGKSHRYEVAMFL